MIKIQLMSDLHIQHWRSAGVNYWQNEFVKETQTDADVLVLAGDIVDLRPKDILWSIDRLNEFGARYKNVLFVTGNHEYYGTGIVNGNALLNDHEKDLVGVTVLKPGRVVQIQGHRFLGGTMWQPRNLLPGTNMSYEISDHRTIKDFNREHFRQFKLFKTFLEKELKEGDIVVSHHAPHMNSISPEWVGDLCNRFFVSPEITPLMLSRRPALWLHGHVHTGFDYMVGPTRVVCNPRGYPNEGVKFNPKKIIELP